MPVDWNLLAGDPEGAGFKSGNDYINKLYAMQAQKQAGALYGSGDTSGAVAALARNGQLDQAVKLQQVGNEQTTFTQGQQDRTTALDAGKAYAAGDYTGAANAYAKGGKVSEAENLNTKQATIVANQRKYIQDAFPTLSGIYQKAGPEGLAHAWDTIAPELQQIGTTPEALAQMKASLQANPEAFLQDLSIKAQAKPETKQLGENLVTFDPTTGKEISRITGDSKPLTEAAKAKQDLDRGLITQADYENIQRKESGVLSDAAVAQRKEIAAARASANDGPPADPEAIKNDVRIWLASKGTINPQYGQGKAGSDARHQFDVQKNGIMKELGVTPEDVASGRASRVSDQATLSMVSKVQAGNNIASNTMKNSIALARTLIPKGGAQGQSPVINRWIQAGRRSILGDKDVATFNNHIDTIADEYAKIMGGGVNGSTASTDSARQDAHERISKVDNAETLNSVLDGLVAETEGKKRSNDGEVASVKERLRGYGGTGANAALPPPAAESTPPPGGPKIRVFNPATGKLE